MGERVSLARAEGYARKKFGTVLAQACDTKGAVIDDGPQTPRAASHQGVKGKHSLGKAMGDGSGQSAIPGGAVDLRVVWANRNGRNNRRRWKHRAW